MNWHDTLCDVVPPLNTRSWRQTPCA